MHMSTSFIAMTMKITKPYTIYSTYKRLYIQENTGLFSVYNLVLFSLFLDNCIVWCSGKHMNHSIAVCVISFTLILLFRNQLLNEVFLVFFLRCRINSPILHQIRIWCAFICVNLSVISLSSIFCLHLQRQYALNSLCLFI